MKCSLLFYSATGNTEVVARTLARTIGGAGFELFDLGRTGMPALSGYDVVGFAAPVFHLGLHPAMLEAVGRLESGEGRPAFLLSTYGMMAGKGLRRLEKTVRSKGFTVIASHAVLCPESYPLFIAKGWTGADSPDEGEKARFRLFCETLSGKLGVIAGGAAPVEERVRLDLPARLIPSASEAAARKKIGTLSADRGACTSCGTCARRCPRGAVKIGTDRIPAFDPGKCIGCWGCYNRCPSGAVRTTALEGDFRYSGPGGRLLDPAVFG